MGWGVARPGDAGNGDLGSRYRSRCPMMHDSRPTKTLTLLSVCARFRRSGVRVQTGQMVPLGYGKYVLSDEVVAIEPLSEGRGPGHRTTVWIRGVSEPLIASRSEEAIVDDLVTPADE